MGPSDQLLVMSAVFCTELEIYYYYYKLLLGASIGRFVCRLVGRSLSWAIIKISEVNTSYYIGQISVGVSEGIIMIKILSYGWKLLYSVSQRFLKT